MYKFLVAAVVTLFAGSALAGGCVGDPRHCAVTTGAASNCKENPSACLDHRNATPGPSLLQRLIERLREAQPAPAPSDTADQPAR